MGLLGTLENFFEHPNDRGRYVVYYYQKERADYYKELLEQKQVWFEYGEEEDYQGNMRYYCIVKRTQFPEAKHLNYLCIGKFRKPFIPNKKLGIAVILIFVLFLTFSIVGYIKSNGG